MNDNMDKEASVELDSAPLEDSTVENLKPEGPNAEAPEANEKPLTFLQVLGSTFAAAVGVQTSANRTRDFSRGKPIHFILAGLIFAATFIAVVVTVVRTVLSQV